MKTLTLILALLLTACAQTPSNQVYTDNKSEAYRVYDDGGNYSGRIDGTYRVYDKDGNFIGMIRK